MQENSTPPALTQKTPWGPAQGQECLAPGIWFVHTAGHGGIWISPARRAEMPEPFRSFSSRYGNIPAGWYEEDCDCLVVLLAFASEMRPALVTLARETIERDRTSGRNYFAVLHPAPRVISRRVEFNENDCSGVFDGVNTVTSDADPGL